jgi:hypothetical protein
VLRSLARRIQAATLEAAELERELLGHVRALAPLLLDEPGVGPIVAAQLIVAWSHPAGSAPKPPSHDSPESHPCQHQAAKQPGTDSAAAATDNSTAPYTPSSYTDAGTTQQPRTTSHDEWPKEKHDATPRVSSSATSPATSTDYCNNRSR